MVASERTTERTVSARPLKAVDREHPNGEERTVNTDVALPLEPVNERIQTLLGQLLPDGLCARVRVVKVRLAVIGLAVGRLSRLASSELTDIEDLDVVLEPLPDKKSERDGKMMSVRGVARQPSTARSRTCRYRMSLLDRYDFPLAGSPT